jgi:ferredoxin
VTVKISIDPLLCEGNAVCEALAPAVFELDGGGQALVLSGADGEVGEEERILVGRAVDGCPRLAISVSE